MNAATAHLVIRGQGRSQAVLESGRSLLREECGIAHATLQVEPPGRGDCDEPGW